MKQRPKPLDQDVHEPDLEEVRARRLLQEADDDLDQRQLQLH